MTRVKLCGLRSREDAGAANRCRPDFAGFVFAPGKRQVDRRTAGIMRDALDPAIVTVGVFVNQAPSWIASLCRDGIIGMVQLHGDETEEEARRVREASGCSVIRAVRVGDRLPPLPKQGDYLLFDALSHTARGGTGHAFSWELLSGVGREYFLAGGLHPGNVREAVSLLRPYCVDVSSGIETEGRKDPQKMAEFVRAVREAP